MGISDREQQCTVTVTTVQELIDTLNRWKDGDGSTNYLLDSLDCDNEFEVALVKLTHSDGSASYDIRLRPTLS